MRRSLVWSSAFVRSVRRQTKKRPGLAENLRTTLNLLAEDAFEPRVKAHKLKGDMAGLFACSVGYDIRIVFELVRQEEAEKILLHSLGSHDEVY